MLRTFDSNYGDLLITRHSIVLITCHFVTGHQIALEQERERERQKETRVTEDTLIKQSFGF